MENINEDVELEKIKVAKEQREMELSKRNVFDKRELEVVKEENKLDEKNELINDMFKDGIKYQVANNIDLQNKVLETAKTYTETKMKVIETNVDTENKEANFNNKKDACESYGFNEKTTPIWATKFMSIGYSVMLSIWLFIGSFTFMPVIFIAKKMSVGLKKTWLAVVFAIILYFGITFVPILIALLS
ncbi:hypothetical protein EOL99_03440 [Candidatus Falkowbacteria bacterium]|nr:hypothetical protein [Candidatus Falkowbacteria bacterium]